MRNEIIAGLSANYSARATSSILSLVFIPFYIDLLGIEAFALIGLYTSLTLWFFALDLGLGQSMTREFARYTAGEHAVELIRGLSFSVEVVFTALILVILVMFSLAVQANGHNWIQAQSIDSHSIVISLQFMGLSLALRMQGTLYRRCLTGLQKQVSTNFADLAINIMRYALTLSVLFLYQTSIVAFFLCQAVMSLVELLVYKIMLMHYLPASRNKMRFKIKLLLRIWRYSAGAGTMTLLTIGITQLDKFILISLVNLEQFGYYSIAFTISAALSLLSMPIISVLQPKLIQLYAAGKLMQLGIVYKYGCRVLALVLIPAAVTLSIFSEQLLFLWQQSHTTIVQAASLTSLLMLSQMVWLLSSINQALQLAHGHTRLLVQCQVITIVLFLPALYLCSKYWGTHGAATVLLITNALYMLGLCYFGHTRWLPQLRFTWYSHYLLPTLVASAVVVFVVKIIFSGNELDVLNSLLQIGLAGFFSFSIAILLSGELRAIIFSMLQSFSTNRPNVFSNN